jgi:hypothetical protein
MHCNSVIYLSITQPRRRGQAKARRNIADDRVPSVVMMSPPFTCAHGQLQYPILFGVAPLLWSQGCFCRCCALC